MFGEAGRNETSKVNSACSPAPAASHVEMENWERREFCPPVVSRGWMPRAKAGEEAEWFVGCFGGGGVF